LKTWFEMDKISLLAIFAHPDDETFRCGGVLALLAQRGVSIHVLTFTTGQAGSCGDPPICTPNKLGIIRTEELFCACRALGLEVPILLDYSDGELSKVHQEEGVAQIITHLHKIRPQVLLTWPPHGLSGHPDHQAVSRWTLEAFQQSVLAGYHELTSLYYLAFPSSLAKKFGISQLHTMPDSEVTISVNIESVWEEKIAAINCHHTQIGQTPILHASLERQKLFFGVEYFFRAISHAPNDVFLEMSLAMND